MTRNEQPAFAGPAAYALADWRRRISELYSDLRRMTDPATAHQLWLERRSALFRDHPMSPLPPADRAVFTEIAAYPYDPALRFAVALRAIEEEALDFDLARDGMMRARPIARTSGLSDRLGRDLTIYWIEGYGGGAFLPFRDATTGDETYGGGRYLIDAIKGADLGLDGEGRLILDFNFAYTPSCALDPNFVCPLSPPENTLDVAIRAGERIL